MRATEHDIEVLRDFEARLEQLMAMIGDKRFLPPGDKQELQRLFSRLKSDMQAVAKSGSAISHGVAGALCNLSFATNSHPINSRWYSGFYAAQMDVRHEIGMHRLE